jgi:mono/diheme cytochrome c family protein
VWRRTLISLLVLASCTTAQQPQPPREADEFGSAARGLNYAQRVCAECHAVAAGEQVSPNPNAPPFTVIANTPGMTPTALNAWLHSAHPSMPNLIVAPEDRADLAAYLEVIRRGGSAG